MAAKPIERYVRLEQQLVRAEHEVRRLKLALRRSPSVKRERQRKMARSLILNALHWAGLPIEVAQRWPDEELLKLKNIESARLQHIRAYPNGYPWKPNGR